MLTTTLFILKIIGISFLILLGAIIALLLLILLWPFKYQVSGDNREHLNGYFIISWFFHLLHIKAYYDDAFNIEARILGIKIYDKNKKSSKNSESKKSNKKDTKKDNKKDNKSIEDEEELYQNKDSLKDVNSSDGSLNSKMEEFDSTSESDTSTEDKESRGSDSDIIEIDDIEWTEEDDKKQSFWKRIFKKNAVNINKKEENDSKKEKKKSIFAKFRAKKKISFGEWLWGIFDKIWDFIDDLPYKISEFAEKPEKKIDELVDTICYYDRILSSKGTEWVISFVKKKIIAILKNIRPRKCVTNVDYASTDPEKAAKAYEMYCMTIPYQPKHTNMNVAFDNDDFRFDCKIKGRFVLGVLLYHGATLIFNKKVKKFIKLMKREGK